MAVPETDLHLRRARVQKWIDAFQEKASRENVHRRYTPAEFDKFLENLGPIARFKYFRAKGAQIVVVEGQLRFRICDSCQR